MSEPSEIQLEAPRPQFWLLTQDHCPRCEATKRMLAGPLKQFNHEVVIVHRQTDPDQFAQLAQNLSIATTPALIRDDGDTYTVQTKLDSILEVRLFLTSPGA